MENILIVLVLEVKYPNSENIYLTACSYIIEKGNMNQLETLSKEFRYKVEADGFKIVNKLIYIIPDEQIKYFSHPLIMVK